MIRLPSIPSLVFIASLNLSQTNPTNLYPTSWRRPRSIGPWYRTCWWLNPCPVSNLSPWDPVPSTVVGHIWFQLKNSKKKYFDSVLSCFFTRNYQQTCIGDCKRTRYTKYTICIIWFFKVSFKISIFYLFSYLCHFEEIVGTPKIWRPFTDFDEKVHNFVSFSCPQI